jgi:hypothetical protein
MKQIIKSLQSKLQSIESQIDGLEKYKKTNMDKLALSVSAADKRVYEGLCLHAVNEIGKLQEHARLIQAAIDNLKLVK